MSRGYFSIFWFESVDFDPKVDKNMISNASCSLIWAQIEDWGKLIFWDFLYNSIWPEIFDLQIRTGNEIKTRDSL